MEKTMDRPKVRFSQSHELVTKHKDQKAKEIEKVESNKGKIRVKSIVPTNFPIKVLKNGQRVLIKEKVHKSHANDLINSSSVPSIYITEECNLKTQVKPIKSSITNITEMSFYDVQNCVDDIQKINIGEPHSSRCITQSKPTKSSGTDISEMSFSDVQSCIDNIQKINIGESHSSSDVLKNTVSITSIDSHEDNDIEFIEIFDESTDSKIKKNHKECSISNDRSKINTNFISTSNCKPNTIRTTKTENKENYSKNISLKSSINRSLSNKILQEATNSSDKPFNGTIAKKTNKLQKPMQLMPCAKFKYATLSNKNKVFSKKSQTQIKKSTVFNVIGNKSNVFLEAGALCKHNDTLADTIYNDKNILPQDLLSRPEYNSMINVMKSMKEIEKEKLVKDYEHLPKFYQNFVSEKVTAALDFSPYETVYKDLIDLSIDDDKFPTKLMRSKDPEPRDKDIVPKLSDFYNPKYTEQHYKTVNPKPLNPINLNTLNAFTISNKVCSWKTCRDTS